MVQKPAFRSGRCARGWGTNVLAAPACLFALLLVSGCSGGILDPQGPVGAADQQMMLNATEIMLVIVVPTILVALAFAWWFRSSNARAERLPHWVYSGQVELIVWSIPLLVILFLAGVIWIGAYEVDPHRPLPSSAKPLEVQVVSLDWKWLFIYPEQGIASVNTLTVPAGTPVHFSLTSASVMNQFFVPQLGSMIATMNHMVTQLWLQADHAGDYFGESAQFSGDGFSGMQFVVHAVPQAEFSAWIEQTKSAGPQLDRAHYRALAQQSSDVQPYSYAAVDPDLFQAVVTQGLPPGPGPQQSNGVVQPQRE